MAHEAIVLAAERVIRDARAAALRTCFEYADTATEFYTDERDVLRWMEHFFEGYFAPCARTQIAATIYSTSNPALFAGLQELSSGQPVLGKNEYVDVSLTDDVILVHTTATKVTPEEDVYHLLLRSRREIILVTSGNLEVRQEEGMQTVRALIKWLLIEQGWIPMHAACVAKHGHVICLTGGKASGKTSTLLNLLASNGCDLVAIDKFLMRDAGRHVEICGLPGKAGIRIGSAIMHPRLLDWVADEPAPFFPHISHTEVQHIAATNTLQQLRTRKEKISLLPTELTRLFTTSIRPVAPLGLFLVPVFDLDVEESLLIPVEPERRTSIVLECYTGLLNKGEGFLLHLFDLSGAVLKERLAALFSEHLPAIPMYELYQNSRTNEQSAKLVADLVGR